MGDEVNRGSAMTRLCAWLVEQLSQLLDAAEREVVQGDLAETGTCGAKAIREVLGLVARRQVAVWLDWRPWLVLTSLVLPIGVMLSFATRWWGVTGAQNMWLFWRLGDVSYLANPGWREDALRMALGVGVSYLALTGWSWTTGFALGRLAPRTRWITLSLLCLVVLFGTFGTLTTAHPRVVTGSLQQHVIFVVFPRLLRTFLVMVPAVLGARRAAQESSLPLIPTVAGICLLVSVTLLASAGLESSLVFGRGVFPSDKGPDGFVVSEDDPRPLWFLSLIMLWPAAYVLATTSWQRLRDRRVLA